MQKDKPQRARTVDRSQLYFSVAGLSLLSGTQVPSANRSRQATEFTDRPLCPGSRECLKRGSSTQPPNIRPVYLRGRSTRCGNSETPFCAVWPQLVENRYRVAASSRPSAVGHTYLFTFTRCNRFGLGVIGVIR